MYSELKANPGDVLLYKSAGDPVGSAISIFSNIGRLFRQGGKYVHSASYIGSGRIIHSHLTVDKRFWLNGATETGVHMARVNEDEKALIDIYRLPYELKSTQVLALNRWLRSKLGLKYDLAAFPSSFVRSVVARIFGWGNFSAKRPWLNDETRWFCSELVSSAFYEALKIEIVPGIHPLSQTPSDLGSSRSILQRIY